MYDICACLTLAHQLATDKEALISHLILDINFLLTVGLKNKNCLPCKNTVYNF